MAKVIGKSEILSTDMADRYLALIGAARSEPGWDALSELTSAHLRRVPFENVSKIYRARIQEIREIPLPDEFLDGIERFNFGGTCYTNNYYFHLLLTHLGYRVRLCGADISVNGAPPDGHMVNVVTIDGKEAICDVGYGAPFWRPVPRDSANDVEVRLGSELYVFKPRDNEGRTRLELYRDDELVHGYVLKPAGRQVRDFAGVIGRSYGDKAPFLNRLLVARFFEDRALVLRNHTLTDMHPASSKSIRLESRDEVAGMIVEKFGMPHKIAVAVLETLGNEIFDGT